MSEINLLPKAITDIAELELLIPQRSPIIMVDKLLHYSLEKVISGFKIKRGNIFLEDTLFVESGLIENMAQTIALYTGYQYFLKNKPAPTGYIGALKKVFIHQLPSIDNELVTTASILHEILGVTLVKVKVEIDGVEIANAEMKTVIAKM